MTTASSVFQEKLILALQRLRSGRPARGAILICEDPLQQEEADLRMQATAFEHCWHVKATVPSGAREQIYFVLPAFQRLIVAKAGLVSDDIKLQLADALKHEASSTAHRAEELMANLFTELGTAAKSADEVLLVSVGDMHRLMLPELAVMLSAAHRSNQLQLPVLLCGTGSGCVRKSIGEAAGYGERLFEFVIESI